LLNVRQKAGQHKAKLNLILFDLFLSAVRLLITQPSFADALADPFSPAKQRWKPDRPGKRA
jgi:hypothetical protein